MLLLLAGLAASVSNFAFVPAHAADPKPKYGPEATLLSRSHEYIRKHAAPDYWAMSPYYVAQQDEASCSLASTAMLVNAARAGRNLTADDELATQPGLLKRVKGDIWKKGLSIGGRGVTLDQLGEVVKESLKVYGVDKFTVEVVHADVAGEAAAKTAERLHRDLTENEKSADDFMLINFIQGVYTGDAEAGHIAPIAAYDAGAKRVLVMDPDRTWYEPYWVSEKTLLKGMATLDKESGLSRGYVYVKVQK